MLFKYTKLYTSKVAKQSDNNTITTDKTLQYSWHQPFNIHDLKQYSEWT